MTQTNRIVIFAGPTLSEREVLEAIPEADVRGPAARGDLLKAALQRPRAIGLIDGYFDHVLSVHHKEVLWALEQGICVYGASSMGALRAAELATLGMVGVGWCFEQFMSGALECDDEVVLVHGPEPRYQPASEALVNIRATLALGVNVGAISAITSQHLIAVGRRLFYPDRHYSRILGDAQPHIESAAEFDAAKAWLNTQSNRVNQKRLDALALLTRISADAEHESLAPPILNWELPRSVYWEALWTEATG